MMNIQKMMQQAQVMQTKIKELQETFKDIEVLGESGGGMVKVVMSCDGVTRSIRIDSSLIDKEDKETLEDLVTAAVNKATEAKDARVKNETRKIMESMGLPGGAQLPF